MAENVTRYQTPSTSTDAHLTDADRQAMHDAARQPGRATYQTATGQYEVEYVQQNQTAAPASEDRSSWWDYATTDSGQRVDVFAAGLNENSTFIPVPDGKGGWDRMSMRAAKNSGLIRKDGRGSYLPFPGSPASSAQDEQKSQEPTQKQQQQTPAEDILPSLPGDSSLGQIASVVGDASVYSMIEATALGQGLSAHRAESIAQVSGNEPGAITAMYDALVSEYGEVGNAALIAAGVPEERITEAIEWARVQKKGELIDAFGDLVRQASRSTSKLKAIGVAYMKATGGAFSDAELESFDLPEGARWHRGSRGELLVTIAGWGTSSAQSAIRQGVLRF